MAKKTIIGVIGAGRQVSARGLDTAEEVGRLIAMRGWTLVCGGLGGVMEAASRGCQQAGGDVIGVLPGVSTDKANPYVTLPIVTGMGHARNIIIAQTAQALIAIEGEHGTLSEIAIGLKLNKSVIQLDSWLQVDASCQAQSAEEAVRLVDDAIKGGCENVG